MHHEHAFFHNIKLFSCEITCPHIDYWSTYPFRGYVNITKTPFGSILFIKIKNGMWLETFSEPIWCWIYVYIHGKRAEVLHTWTIRYADPWYSTKLQFQKQNGLQNCSAKLNGYYIAEQNPLAVRLPGETRQAWFALLAMAEAYSEIVWSGDCLRCTIIGSSSDDRRKSLQTVWSHILRSAKSTILSGDSVRASFLLGLRATAE